MPKGKQTTALAKWDEELAKQAQVAAGMESGVSSGQFFSLKSGVLSFGGAPMPGNEMAVVILDAILENVYYEGKYAEGVANSPKCFAFGRDEAEMAPHEICDKADVAECENCAGCTKNLWGSADIGKGKACRNSRRLALIPAGTFDSQGRLDLIEDVAHYQDAEVGYLRLPVTSVKGFSTFVKQLAATLRRPPHGVVTRIKVVPDAQTQLKVVFSAVQALPDSVMPVIMERHAQAVEAIAFPYPAYDPAPKAKSVPTAAPARPGRGRKF